MTALRNNLTKCFATLFLLLIIFVSSQLALAQEEPEQPTTSTSQDTTSSSPEGLSLGIAHIMTIKDTNAKDGNIVSSSPEGAILTTTPYDPQVLGVVSHDAAIILNLNGVEQGIPVVNTGNVYVLVSSKEGAIKKGDFITTSTIPGVGVKATRGGYVIGVAMEDYDSPNPDEPGKIAVALNLHYFNTKPTILGTLSDIFKFAIFASPESPTSVFKYIAAALVTIVSFGFGFMTFGRAAAKGVEALGRNPAASRIIHLGILFNVGITVSIVAAGLAAGFFILRL